MNSVELPAPHIFSSETSHWDEVRRIYRRMCVLRATGKNEDAVQLEHTDLAQALSVARIAAINQEEESAVLAQEAERVANATVLAELLAPMLAEHLRIEGPPKVAAAVPAIPEKRPTTARPAPAKAPSIADLLDGMLSQQPTAPASGAARL